MNVIDESNRELAAACVAKRVPTSTALSYMDIFQDAWIELEKRLGKAFATSVKWTAIDLKRRYYGRNQTEEESNIKYLLNHSSVDTEFCKKNKEIHDSIKIDSEEIYQMLLEHFNSLGHEWSVIFQILSNEQHTNNINKRIGDALGICESRGHQKKRQFYEIVRSKFPDLDPR